MARTFLFFLFVLAATAAAQDDSLRFYRQGDALVFARDDSRFERYLGFPGYSYQASWAAVQGVQAVLKDGGSQGGLLTGGGVFVDSNHIVTLGEANRSDGPLFPLPPVEKDTLMAIWDNDTLEYILTRTADTVIFSTPVKAYYLDLRYRPEYLYGDSLYLGVRSIVVADSFGLVHFREPLYNAIVHGKEYLHRIPFCYKAFCIGNQWHTRYSVHSTIKWRAQKVVSDTVINGFRYYKSIAKADYDADWGGYSFERSDSTGVYRLTQQGETRDSTVDVWLGRSEDAGIVYSITKAVPGIPGRTSYGVWNGRSMPEDGGATYIDSVGRTSWYWSGEDDIESIWLAYYKVCGIENGTPVVGIEPSLETLSSFSLGQNYPNPVSLSSSVTTIPIAATHSAPTQLILTDMLGREVRRVEIGSGQETVTVNVQGLPPGVYWYRMEGVQARAQKLVVVP